MVKVSRGWAASLILAAAVAVTGCHGGHAQADASGKAALKAAATSPAVQEDRKRAEISVVQPCLAVSGSSVTAFGRCAEAKSGIVGKSPAARAKRKALAKCLFAAAKADKAYKKGNAAGRATFMNVGAPECVAAELPARAGKAGKS